MGLDMYLRTRKKDWQEKIPRNVLSESGAYIDDSERFIKQLGTDRVLDLILNRYIFVWQDATISHVGLELTKEVGYWRKANAIHNWFVENVQDGEDDCGYYVVTKEQLKALQGLCEKVCESLDDNDMMTTTNEDGFQIDVYNNTELANDLLPTIGGFFFGGKKYDKYYKEDLLDTIKICNDCQYIPDDMEILYHSSW